MDCRLFLAGEEALARLESTRFTCLAAFSRSFYLKNDAAGLVCLVQKGLEPGPLNAFCNPWPGDCLPAPGEAVVRSGNTLRWGGAAVSLAGAETWRVPDTAFPFPSDSTRGAGSLPLPREAFFNAVSPMLPDEGFAPLFPFFFGEEPLPAALPPLLAAGAAAIAPFAAWLATLRGPARDAPHAATKRGQCAMPPDVRGLLGLGPGLTPSGDDVLGGTMIALHATGKPDAARMVHAALRALPGHTNAISLAHLEAAARGRGAEALHLCLAGLLQGRFPEGAFRRLGRIGHSSGWDMALGMALVLYPCAARILPFTQNPG